MGKPLKIVLYSLITLALVIVIAAIVLPFIIDPNDFKPQLAAAVKKQTGRQLDIAGDLHLSVFPWLGIKTGKIALDNPPEFQKAAAVFAEIDELSVKVKLLPLLSKQIEVDRIMIDGLSLNLIKNKQGISNWDDLIVKNQGSDTTKVPANKTPAAAAESVGALAIAGLSLKNSTINWNDLQAENRIRVKALNLETDQLVFNEPMSLNLGFELEAPKAELNETIKLATMLDLNKTLDHVKLTEIDLTSQTQAPNVPGGVLKGRLQAAADLDLKSQRLVVSGLKVNAGTLNLSADITGTSIKDHPQFAGPVSIASFNPSQLLRQWQIDLPAMQAPDALSRLSADFNLKASPTSAELQNLSLKLDDSSLTGTVRLDRFAPLAVVFNLAIDTLDLDRYLPPKQQKPAAAKNVASPAAAVAAGASLFPVATLKQLNVDGLLGLDKLKANNLTLQGLHLKLKAKNGVLSTEQRIDNLYQGSYSGALNLNVNGRIPVLAVNESMAKVRIEPLLTDLNQKAARITGNVNANATLQSSGNSPQQLKSSLNGQLAFDFTDGVIKGFNLQQTIDDAKSLIKGSPLVTDNPKDQTVFSEIKGTADVINGVIVNKDLSADSSKVNVTGAGNINLNTEQVDYQLKGRLVKSKATATQPAEFSALPVIIDVKGSFNKPAVTLDVAQMLLEKNKQKLEQKKDQLLEKLDKKLEKQLGPKGASDLLKKFF